MRVMVLIKATSTSESGKMPGEELLAEMGRFNEELVKAGVMHDGNGLHPSSRGKRIRFSGTEKTVIDGPFANTSELVAGYWLWKVKDMDEALEWAKRCPHPMPGENAEIELRPIFEPEDFGSEMTDELKQQEARHKDQIERIRES